MCLNASDMCWIDQNKGFSFELKLLMNTNIFVKYFLLFISLFPWKSMM